MVIGELKIESSRKVKDNLFYGDFEIRNEYKRTIINEKYEGLISPKYGIVIRFKSIDAENLTITIDRHYFTGLKPTEIVDGGTFDTTFGYNGAIYQVCVNIDGELEEMYEWYSRSDYDDGNEPDNHYTKRSKSVKWEKLDR